MLRKPDDESRRKAEEEETARALRDFEATFQETAKINRTWVKGGVVNPGSNESKSDSVPAPVYKPVPKFSEKAPRNLEVGKVESKSDGNKKPIIGKKPGTGKKMSNLEIFKEELKNIQQQREQRHQLRQHGRGKNAASDVRLPPDLPPSELSLDLEDMERRNRPREFGYPYDEDADSTTTNLFLGNLCPQMTEQQLCEIFGRYGPLASVKIMWPRTEEQRAVARNCGFVAFMNRVDAERALENLRGKELLGYEMKLGWGKTVHVPVYPVYIPPPLLELIKPPAQSGLPFNAQPREWLRSIRSSVKERAKLVTDSIGSGGNADPHAFPPPAPDRFPFNIHTMPKEKMEEVLQEAVVKVIIPTDRTVLATIHRLIEFVVREGPQFEAAIMHREEKNNLYKFLFDYQTPEHLYYRWKLWSILHGEQVDKWSLEEFRMYEGGPLWRPPPANFLTNGMPEELVEVADYPVAPGYVSGRSDDLIDPLAQDEALRRSSTMCLTSAQRGRLAVWVNDLEPSRARIGDVMLWCLEHADAAHEVADLVAQSVSKNSNQHQHSERDDGVGEREERVKPPTSIQSIVARLYLTSDILYNSGAKVPNASYYRRCFETRLPNMFSDIGTFYRELESKIKAEQLKQKVMLCFRAWEEWAIYPNDFLIKLQNTFLGLIPPQRNRVVEEDAEAVNDVQNANIDDDDDLAGVPIDSHATTTLGMTALTSNVESLDGAPLVQYDPLDADGTSPPGTGGDDEDDLEGVPLDLGSPKAAAIGADSAVAGGPLFVPSKWESIDPSKAAEEAVTSNRWELFVDDQQNTAAVAGNNDVVPLGMNADDDEDVDGKPLEPLGVGGFGLVAYDDDDVGTNSPVISTVPAPTHVMTEARRQALREIEVKVMKYQDELEACRKNKSDSASTSQSEEAITKQVERFRERLVERLDDSKLESVSPSSKVKYSSSINKSKSSSSSKPESSAASSSSSKRHQHGGGGASASFTKRHANSSSRSSNRSSQPPEKRSRQAEETTKEEGEASDSDSVHSAHKKSKHRGGDESRKRDKSPRRSRRSKSPSPTTTISSRKRVSSTGTPSSGGNNSSRSSQKRR